MYNIPLIAESPIIQPQNVESAQPGFEALQQGLSKFSAGETAVGGIALEYKSNANMYVSMADLGKLEGFTTEKLDLAKSPEEVGKILQEYRTQSTSLIEGAPLSLRDRGTLSYITGRQVMEIERQGGDLQARMTISANRATLIGGLPILLQDYQAALLTDPKAAAEISKSLTTNWQNALDAGIITPGQFDKTMTTIGSLQERATNLIDMVSGGKADAKVWHKLTSFDGKPVGSKPANEVTKQWMVNNQESGAFNDAISDIYQGKLDENTYLSLTDKQQITFDQTYDGVQEANSFFDSNMPLPLIQERLDELNNTKHVLTTAEGAERNQLRNRMNLLQTDYIGFLDTTSAGAQLTQAYKMEVIGINNSHQSEEQKYNQLLTKKNQLMDDEVRLGDSMGIPTQYIQPAQQQDVIQIQDAFKLGADPSQSGIGDVIKSYSVSNSGWLGNSIKNPDQAEIVTAGSMARDKDSFAYLNTMVAANQKGQNYSLVDSAYGALGNGGLTPAVNSAVTTQLMPVFNYLKDQPNGAERIQSILTDATNYVKYRALSSNDLEVKSMSTYTAEAAQLFKDAYPTVQGNGYSFNTNQINLPTQELKNVVAFAQDAANQKLIDQLGPAKAQEYLSNNTLTVTNTPTNQIIVVDPRGQLLLSWNYGHEFLQGVNGFAYKQQTALEVKRAAQMARANQLNKETGDLLSKVGL